MQATTPKGIVGGVDFTVFSKKFERESMDICLRMLKESNKSRFDSYSVRKGVLNISQITFRDSRLHICLTTFLEIAVRIYWGRK